MSYIADTHCDTLSLLSKNNFLCGSADMNLSLPRLLRGNIKLQCFAVCVHPDNNGKCFAEGIKLVDKFDKLISDTELLTSVKTAEDITDLPGTSRIGAMLTVEGGDILDENENNIDILYERGMRMFSFTWNNSNFLCGGIGENSSGLTQAGKNVLARCEEKGIIIDVSHISEKGFFDVVQNSSVPFIASHSNAKKICSHKRNLSDEQLTVIKKCNGCVGINFYPPFLNNSGIASVEDIIRHIEYIASLIGVEYICIGSDFDGVENNLPRGMEHPGKMQSICERLCRLNYPQKYIDMICHENIFRVLKNILPSRAD